MNNLRVAILLPSLANKGSLIVAKDIVNNLHGKNFSFEVFYFDNKFGLHFFCKVNKLDYKKPFDFTGFDVVHSHGYRPDRFIKKNSKEIRSVKMSTVHCDIFEDLRYSYGKVVSLVIGQRWRRALSCMHVVITLTEYHKLMYSRMLRRTNLFVIPNGRDIDEGDIESIDKNEIRKIKSDNPDDTIIGSICVVNKRKGLDQIIKSMTLVKNTRFLLIGEGAELESLKSLSLKLGVSDRCHFFGYRKNGHLYAQHFDIFILPSHSEAFPLSIIESLSYQTPVISSDLGVIVDAYSKNEVCFFELGNVLSLVEAINKVRQNIESYSYNGYRAVTERYSLEKMISEYSKIYQRKHEK